MPTVGEKAPGPAKHGGPRRKGFRKALTGVTGSGKNARAPLVVPDEARRRLKQSAAEETGRFAQAGHGALKIWREQQRDL